MDQMKMRTFLLLLLTAALCLHRADSLKCYTCLGADTNSKCLTETACLSVNKYCMTAVGSASGKSIISKQCLPGCTPGESEFQGVKATISCCETDLCNYSGATSVKISYLVLVISAGFICSLLRAGL